MPVDAYENKKANGQCKCHVSVLGKAAKELYRSILRRWTLIQRICVETLIKT